MYNKFSISCDGKWSPRPGKHYVKLATVERGRQCREEVVGHVLHGNVKEMLKGRREISMEEILKPDKGQDKIGLVLIEGAPGIGKSTLAWELCRNWKRLVCMEKYALVVLLRLREKKVQQIGDIPGLFPSYGGDTKSLGAELEENRGEGVLFILDGFDELLQSEGFLVDLIRGYVLPECSVVVTSRPSATAELLTICHPQKHIEILGFTQESVEDYASSIFTSEPERLDFLRYISASSTPAINSLMYVPLNAAIIVEIFRSNKKSRSPLPTTLTQLYTQLCLTYLRRYLKPSYPSVKLNGFEDLPGDFSQHFIRLAKIAFEGVKKKEVSVPSDLVHFGLLDIDTFTSLCGGGENPHNFLHLTLQEFLAAYHISQLSGGGLKVFKQYGSDKHWSVVWRFVAGLTKLKYFKSHINGDVFMTKRNENEIEVSPLFIQCLFEAQSVDYESIFRTKSHMKLCNNPLSEPLDKYALGYCIANSNSRMLWNVNISLGSADSFKWGLKTCVPCGGTIEELCIDSCSINIDDLHSYPLLCIKSLELSSCLLKNSDMVHLSKIIPTMTNLEELDIHDIPCTEGCKDGLLKVLQQLSYSNVTKLNIMNTGYCELLHATDFYSVMTQLIHPSSGRLKELYAGDIYSYDCELLIKLTFSLSSLEKLVLHSSYIDSLSGLETNTCLTTLEMYNYNYTSFCDDIVKVLKQNKTLQYLQIGFFEIPDEYELHEDIFEYPEDNEFRVNITELSEIVQALNENTTLQHLILNISEYSDASSFIEANYPELTLDPRISWQ